MNDKTKRLAAEVIEGDRRSIARAITLIEAKGPVAASIIKGVYPYSGRASVIGVTGSPGVGKSTLVDRVTAIFRSQERTVGVLAVDPTSPFSGGAVLGDRVRMQMHAGDSGVFVRSMATRGQLGGLSRATSDAVVILDAAGFNVIILETVGVGQAEVEVSRTADMTIVVTMPGAGDSVQALKAGVMETADVFVVNKADHEGADRAVSEIESMLALHEYGSSDWRPPVLQIRARDGRGVAGLVEVVDRFVARGGERTERRRRERVNLRLRQIISDRFFEHAERGGMEPGTFNRLIEQVAGAAVDPYTAADEILSQVLAASEGGSGRA